MPTTACARSPPRRRHAAAEPTRKVFCRASWRRTSPAKSSSRRARATPTAIPQRQPTSIWVVGENEWWFGGTTGDRMDLLPEQKEYDAGDTARFQVRMPFRSATALVTVEREGVMRSVSSPRSSGSEPIVEVPINDADSPNVFVSVLAVRGRVGAFCKLALRHRATVRPAGFHSTRRRATDGAVDLEQAELPTRRRGNSRRLEAASAGRERYRRPTDVSPCASRHT